MRADRKRAREPHLGKAELPSPVSTTSSRPQQRRLRRRPRQLPLRQRSRLQGSRGAQLHRSRCCHSGHSDLSPLEAVTRRCLWRNGCG